MRLSLISNLIVRSLTVKARLPTDCAEEEIRELLTKQVTP